MIKLEKSNTARVVTFAEMKAGQIGEIVVGDCYVGNIVIRRVGDMVVNLSDGHHWTMLDSISFQVRLLEVGDTLVITEN